jgi:hypothetical protein
VTELEYPAIANTGSLVAIVMRHPIIILTLLLFCFSTWAQKRKLPPKGTSYPISKFRFDYPLQTGRLEILNIDSATILRTDSSEMRLGSWYILDSITIDLFKSGIVTPDILIRAINEEAKFINYLGDTIDHTNHITTKYVQLNQIQKEQIPKYIKKKNGVMFFKIAVTFRKHVPNEGLPTIYDFNLYLEADKDSETLPFPEYLKKVRKKYLQYVGMEI